MSFLPELWFVLIGIFFTVYVILDSFDSGIEFWYLFFPSRDRQLLLNKIRYHWRGNKLWLLAGLTALFVTFPRVFTFFVVSFYPVIILIVGIFIVRTLACTYRNAVKNNLWITACDSFYAIGKYILPLVFGIAAGNILMGVPLDRHGHYAGTFSGLFSHYTIAAGLIGIAMFATQGALYLTSIEEEPAQKRALRWAYFSWIGYLVLFIYLTIYSVAIAQHTLINFFLYARLLLVPLCGLIALIAIPFLLKKRKIIPALISSSISITMIMAICGISVFPFLVPTFGNIGKSLKISNAAATDETLLAMLLISLVAVPIMVMYTITVYRNDTRTPGEKRSI